MHPKYKRKAAKLKAAKAKANGADDKVVSSLATDIQSRKFPGLAMPDSEWRPLDDYLDERTGKEPVVDKLPESISMDNTMAELAAVAARRNRPAAEDYIDGEPSNKRMRNGGGGYERDNGYGSRNGGGREVDGGYGSRLGGSRGRPGPDAMDDAPVLYKIYSGNVSNVRDFGAFVSLEGIRGRVEGGSFHILVCNMLTLL
jgi:ATP-dependent RNA helicase DHX8/PRP22